MDENKNNNQEQVNIDDLKNEMTELEALKAENADLKTQNEELKKKVEYQRDTNCKEYRKVEILKGALKILKEKYSISDGDFYAAMLSGGNGELDIDSILYQLSK